MFRWIDEAAIMRMGKVGGHCKGRRLNWHSGRKKESRGCKTS